MMGFVKRNVEAGALPSAATILDNLYVQALLV